MGGWGASKPSPQAPLPFFLPSGPAPTREPVHRLDNITFFFFWNLPYRLEKEQFCKQIMFSVIVFVFFKLENALRVGRDSTVIFWFFTYFFGSA